MKKETVLRFMTDFLMSFLRAGIALNHEFTSIRMHKIPRARFVHNRVTTETPRHRNFPRRMRDFIKTIGGEPIALGALSEIDDHQIQRPVDTKATECLQNKYPWMRHVVAMHPVYSVLVVNKRLTN